MAVNIAQIATLNRLSLYQGQPSTSVATVYTVPASTDVKVTSVVLCNTTATPATVTLSAVPSGGTAGVANRLLAGFTVAANDTVQADLHHFMTTGGFLAALQGTSGAITVSISGESYA